jgi:SHS2 domain-containing protein
MPHLPANTGCARGFEEVEHTADRAVRIWGRDLAELFVNAALGMNSLMLAADADREPALAKHITLEAIDAENLLVAWLSELAFWAETELLIFTRFEFRRIAPTGLSALARGNSVGALEKHVKAVTFHNLEIKSVSDGLSTTVVFDV